MSSSEDLSTLSHILNKALSLIGVNDQNRVQRIFDPSDWFQLLYTVFPSDVLKSYDLSYPFYADDSQIYMPFHRHW